MGLIVHQSFVLCCGLKVLCVFVPWTDKDTLAPPIKQKARFKIKDAKCHLRPRNKEKHRDSSRQNLQGKPR